MDAELLNFVDVPKLLLTILFIIPGFLAEEESRKRFPFKPSTTFERTVYSICYSVIIHFFFLVILILYFSIRLNQPPWTSQPYMAVMQASKLLPVVFIYCVLAIAAGKLCGFFLVKYYEWNKEATAAFFPLWSQTFPDDKITFARVRLKDGTLCSGQIKYIPSDYDVLSSSEKDIYMIQPYIFRNGYWKNLSDEGVKGILLNTKDIVSLELAFRDIKKYASG